MSEKPRSADRPCKVFQMEVGSTNIDDRSSIIQRESIDLNSLLNEMSRENSKKKKKMEKNATLA